MAERAVTVFAITLLALAAGVLVLPAVQAIPVGNFPVTGSSSPAIHRTFWLEGNAFLNWNRTNPGPLISVSNGDAVTIWLISNDGNPHNWFLDFNNNFVKDVNENATTSPDFISMTTWVNFTFTPLIGMNIPHGGNWTYRCQYHARAMYGTFRVLPSASFVYAPGSPLVGQTISFDSSASRASIGATIANYSWTFGDGNKAVNSPTVIHTYTALGSFTVILNITDSLSQTDTTNSTLTVTITPPPFDYNLSIAPVFATVSQGQNINAAVRVNLVSGTTETVSLASTVSPSDSITVTLTPVSGNPPFNLTMTITTTPLTPVRTFAVNVTGTSRSGIIRWSSFSLSVVHPTPTGGGARTINLLLIGGGSVVVATLVLAILFWKRRKPRGLTDPSASP